MPATARLRLVARHVGAQGEAALERLELERGHVGASAAQWAELRDDGLTIVDDAVTPELLPRLCAAARELVSLARSREETGGFVMRHSPDAGPWGIRGVSLCLRLCVCTVSQGSCLPEQAFMIQPGAPRVGSLQST